MLFRSLHRDGLIPSGGAASLILEDLDHALERGAPIYGEIKGYGFSSNGKQISQASVSGALSAMERALADAAMCIDEIDYINAHATSTQQGDACEATALVKLLNNRNIPVSSTKSMTGHECWMAGASEIVYSLLMMQNDFIAPNINFDTPDPSTQNLHIVTQTLHQPVNTFLSNSFGFGGTNSTLIVKKFHK